MVMVMVVVLLVVMVYLAQQNQTGRQMSIA